MAGARDAAGLGPTAWHRDRPGPGPIGGTSDEPARRPEGGRGDGPLRRARRPPDDEAGDLTAPELDQLQLNTLMYYLHETNPDNGLVRDKTAPTAPASIAAVGMALATLPVVVERGVIIREFAAKIARRRLRFLLDCPQGPEPDASGYKGFFYHFLDIETGRRVWQCELSTVDSAFLLAGAAAHRRLFRPRYGRRGRDSPASPTRSTAGPTGTGPATAGRR